ncbi:hypothetical protein L1987_27275 [Smallanthus sonchifolius]|uniref:Uncharacterized protein n=1 Tax=Smallanthus sonchifolius TaxID=185202 RepID=A0ACB9IBM4_9ASTR|nr:hypothetical protein L1987_27275 [Smallanthus sonchifolius]
MLGCKDARNPILSSWYAKRMFSGDKQLVEWWRFSDDNEVITVQVGGDKWSWLSATYSTVAFTFLNLSIVIIGIFIMQPRNLLFTPKDDFDVIKDVGGAVGHGITHESLVVGNVTAKPKKDWPNTSDVWIKFQNIQNLHVTGTGKFIGLGRDWWNSCDPKGLLQNLMQSTLPAARIRIDISLGTIKIQHADQSLKVVSTCKNTNLRFTDNDVSPPVRCTRVPSLAEMPSDDNNNNNNQNQQAS